MIKIVLSDDNEPFRKSSREIGAALGFDVSCFDDWERAQAELDSNFEKYTAVVIDGKGKLRDNAKGEDKKHLVEALMWFREQKAKKRFIPVVIYTGYHPEIAELTEKNEQVIGVFDKSKINFEGVLNVIKGEVAKVPEQKFKIGCPDAYPFTEKYFSPDNKKLIRELFSLLQRSADEFIWKKNTLDALRRLNEALVDTIPFHYYSSPFSIQEYLEKITRESSINVKKGGRTLSIISFFHDNQLYVPDPIDYTIRNIYDAGSKYSIHSEAQIEEYFPSLEMILGLAYSHLGSYHWFNSIIKD
jgi:hypothetical protein